MLLVRAWLLRQRPNACRCEYKLRRMSPYANDTTPPVDCTGHQAFLTREALAHIAETTLINTSDFQLGRQKSDNLVTATANRTTKAGCTSVACAPSHCLVSARSSI
jgi:hypothetical protein